MNTQTTAQQAERPIFHCPCGRRDTDWPLQGELDSGKCYMCHDDAARANGTFRYAFYSED